MARSSRSRSVRTVLPSFKLLLAAAAASAGFAWYQGALPAIPGLPKPPQQAREAAPAGKAERKIEASLPARMPLPSAKPQATPRTRLNERPGQPPRPQAIVTGAIPRAAAPTTATGQPAEQRGPVKPEIARRPNVLPARPTGQVPASPLPGNASSPIAVPTGRMPNGLRPARPAQRGDCQCPYDLMLNGEQCGQRSAFLTPGWTPPLCYL